MIDIELSKRDPVRAYVEAEQRGDMVCCQGLCPEPVVQTYEGKNYCELHWKIIEIGQEIEYLEKEVAKVSNRKPEAKE